MQYEQYEQYEHCEQCEYPTLDNIDEDISMDDGIYEDIAEDIIVTPYTLIDVDMIDDMPVSGRCKICNYPCDGEITCVDCDSIVCAECTCDRAFACTQCWKYVCADCVRICEKCSANICSICENQGNPV